MKDYPWKNNKDGNLYKILSDDASVGKTKSVRAKDIKIPEDTHIVYQEIKTKKTHILEKSEFIKHFTQEVPFKFKKAPLSEEFLKRPQKRSEYFTVNLISHKDYPELAYAKPSLEKVQDIFSKFSKRKYARILVWRVLVFIEGDKIEYGTIGDRKIFDKQNPEFDLIIRAETPEEVSERRYKYPAIKVNRGENFKMLHPKKVQRKFKKYAQDKDVRLVFVTDEGRHDGTFFIEKGKAKKAELNGDLTLFWDYIIESLNGKPFELYDEFFDLIIDEE